MFDPVLTITANDTRAVDAVARELDHVCFNKEVIAAARLPEFREHMMARRRQARRTARIVIGVLVERGWGNEIV